MDHKIITRLEDLPVEISIEIFHYLTPDELYLSFSQLNSRLNSILKSLPGLILLTWNHLDPSVVSFFNSFKAIHIVSRYLELGCRCKSHSINGGNRLFDMYPSLDVYWHPRSPNGIKNIIRPDICLRLESLVLPAASLKLAESIFRGEFPRLKICHLGKCKPIVFPLSMNVEFQNLRQLTIREQNGCALDKILSICPFLVHLDFSCHDVIFPFVRTTRCFSSMKYLRLGRLEKFLFHNGQFDFLLSLFPNLLQFHLTVDQCDEHVETIELKKIANCLLHRCPLLKILAFNIYMQGDMRSYFSYGFKKITEMHFLFNYISKCESLIMISSHGFVPHHVYCRRYVRPSSE